MSKIFKMEYQLIRDFDDFFEERVRKAIDEGWEPVGGVAMSQSENDMFGFAYAQAMVKKNSAWKNLEEAQPKIGARVLATDGRDIFVAEYAIGRYWGPGFIVHGAGKHAVTHWMPLPDLP